MFVMYLKYIREYKVTFSEKHFPFPLIQNHILPEIICNQYKKGSATNMFQI